jgi:hypothetical protein
LQPNNFSPQEIAGIFRFAVLLSGSPQAARAAVLEFLPAVAEKIEQMRDENKCKLWLMTRLRERLLKISPQPDIAESVEPAARFSQIPEPGRSALALLCLDLPPRTSSRFCKSRWKKCPPHSTRRGLF